MPNQNPREENGGCREFEKCLEILNLMLDNEAEESDEKYLMDHIEQCIVCFEQYEVEKQLRLLLKTKLSNKAVPVDLASEIKRKVFQST